MKFLSKGASDLDKFLRLRALETTRFISVVKNQAERNTFASNLLDANQLHRLLRKYLLSKLSKFLDLVRQQRKGCKC